MSPYYCHKCRTTWKSDRRSPGFKEICPACSAYLHCCKNCRFHTPTAHNQCYVPNTDYVASRSGLNFCEEFEFRKGMPDTKEESKKLKEAKDAFSGLFGDQEQQDTPASFDDLFKS
ncbi:MAG TPA: hypothetical protein PLL36_14390 [Candidatus Hydrogenedentes bacterium]|nr:MAG: hypothetical protein BWY09_01249 [Candidatus Hydrogenedentes bacterium ADurb.Bin179]HOC68984.1 hypothetical protein [Candidatus Hydrogenedentota bacterium]HQN02266.1 hypothetical protein [Candidatus Hydrogenedentota bacterium]